MKNAVKLLLMCWIISGLSIVGSAQQDRTGSPPPPPPPADDYFPKRWKEFVSQEAGFRVLLPGTPQKFGTTPGDLTVRIFSYRGVISHEVLYVEYPSIVGDSSKVKKLLDSMCDIAMSNVAQSNPRIIKEADFSLDGNAGRFFQIELTGEIVVRVKCILVKNRVYKLIATSRKGQPNVMGSENDYEEIAMAFLDSFQLTKP